jgi:hypothetical protein
MLARQRQMGLDRPTSAHQRLGPGAALRIDNPAPALSHPRFDDRHTFACSLSNDRRNLRISGASRIEKIKHGCECDVSRVLDASTPGSKPVRRRCE